MTWSIPDPGALASVAAGVFEQSFPGADARSPNSGMAVISRVTGMSVYDAYLYQARLAQELMPDTALDWLDRHGAIWGVPRGNPQPARGNAAFVGADDIVVPGGVTLTSVTGVAYTTDSAVTLAGGAVAPVTAVLAGVGGNLAGGAVLTLASPIGGLAPQSGAVDLNGLAGGVGIEALESWRVRILSRIRQQLMGGAPADYEAWVQQASPGAYLSVQPAWVGLGTVGLLVAMRGPLVPTPSQLAAIAAYVAPRKPVTAQVVVVPASLLAVDVSLHLSPDTVAIRAATLAALGLFFDQDAAIGGTIFISRLDAAISSASGEYSHERALPAADVAMGATQMPVLGSVIFT